MADIISKEDIEAPLKMARNFEPLIQNLDTVAASADAVSKGVMKQKDSMSTLAESEKKLSTVSKEFAATQKKLAEETKKSETGLANQQKQVNKNISETQKLKNEIKQLESELIRLQKAGQADTEQFRKMANQVGQLRDEYADMKDAIKNVSASPIENLSNSLGTLWGQLKSGDFGGALASSRQFADTLRTTSFKELIQGGKDFVSTLGNLTKAFLTSPLGIMAAVIGGIALAYMYMKSEAEKAFNATVDGANRAIEKLEEQYDLQIKILDIQGKKTFETERLKQQAIAVTAQKAIDALGDVTEFDLAESIVQRKIARTVSEDKVKQLSELTKKRDAALREWTLINEREKADALKTQKEITDKTLEELRKQVEARMMLENQIRDFLIKRAEDVEIKTVEVEGLKLKAIQDRFDEEIILTQKHIEELKKLNEEDADNYRNSQLRKLRDARTFLEQSLEQINIYVPIVGDIFDGLTERRLQNIQEEQEALKEQYDNDKNLAGDNKRAKEELDKQYAQAKKQLDKEAAEEKRRMAIFDKALAVLNSSIKLSLAIIEAAIVPSPQNIAGAVVAGLQTAAIAATPIPKYKKGTKNHPGGWAIVNEVGSELINENGKMKLFNSNGPIAVNLAKGAEVKTASETQQLLGAGLMEEVKGLRQDLRSQPKTDYIRSAGQLIEVKTFKDGSKQYVHKRVFIRS
jgi:hypothetical protein